MSDQASLKRVLEAFDEQEWGEIHLVTGDIEVHLVASGRSPELAQTSHVSRVEGVEPATELLAPEVRVAAPSPVISPADAVAAGGTGVDSVGSEDAVVVTAPTPGIFWRAPSPGAPPFTEVGTHVEPSTQLCIVEVMKLMNTLPAPVAGTVVEIGAKNGEQVEAGQPLFRIQPDRA